ncbi:hypothetical protein K490DRAFT_19004, partial [Saccharata proteae CBS 121410]
MGRKPSKLILEFFERGPKLEDASNRYQQTCRSCGEKFPKGRLDSLTTHLVKRCPALTDRDRQRAILQFHDLPDLPASASSPPGGQNAGQSGSAMNSLPFAAPKEGMSALETLAEVSRQHLDLSGKRVSTPAAEHEERRGSMRADGLQNGGQVFEDFLVQDEKPVLEEGYDMPSAAHGFAASHAPEDPMGHHASIYQYDTVPNSIPHSTSASSQSLAATTPVAPHPSSLVMTASAAEELRAAMPNPDFGMGQDQTMSNGNMFQSQARPSQSWPQAIDPMLQESGKDQMEGQNGVVDGNGNVNSNNTGNNPFSRPAGMNEMVGQQTTHFAADYSLNHKPSKPKVRGRFSDSRRKEVQEVRKRGACIRCRMLKKPCSEGSPCSTCVNVESARLWKQPCIRTRIAEEFNLYSAGLHVVLAFHTVSQAKSLTRFDQQLGRIEATHCPESCVYMTFTPLRGQRPVNPAIDPALLTDVEMIDNEVDDVGGKLELYIKRLAPFLYESEASAFMKATLVQAHQMSETNKEGLLGKVLELWIATRMLVDPKLSVQLFINDELRPYKEPIVRDAALDELESAASTSRIPVDAKSRPQSYSLMVAQLLAAAEKRAATLSKFVMNDLERRLVQRQQANPFETFLVAIILLSCVERMCWLFRSWDCHQQQQQQQQQQTTEREHSPSNGDNNGAQYSQPQQEAQHRPPPPPPNQPSPTRWPLDKPPSYYWHQGERFSDILHMLLKMRQVPPKTT